MRILVHSQPSHLTRENQDAIAVRKYEDACLVALADGQGGSAGGALGARLATQTALDFLEGEPNRWDENALRLAISVADEAVEAEVEAGLTTLIVVSALRNQIVGASVGDSQVWHIGERRYVELTARQRKSPPLGSGAALGTPFRITAQTGEQVLLMSDGVFRWVQVEDVVKTCQQEDDDSILPRLLALQKPDENGSLPDDWSAVLLRF